MGYQQEFRNFEELKLGKYNKKAWGCSDSETVDWLV